MVGVRLEERFGAHLRVLRKARVLTQETLAERSDLSVDAIRRIERGAFSPSLETIGKLSVGLDVSLPTLFQGLERERRDVAAEISDMLTKRSRKELRLAWRLLAALFDERGVRAE